MPFACASGLWQATSPASLAFSTAIDPAPKYQLAGRCLSRLRLFRGCAGDQVAGSREGIRPDAARSRLAESSDEHSAGSRALPEDATVTYSSTLENAPCSADPSQKGDFAASSFAWARRAEEATCSLAHRKSRQFRSPPGSAWLTRLLGKESPAAQRK